MGKMGKKWTTVLGFLHLMCAGLSIDCYESTCKTWPPQHIGMTHTDMHIKGLFCQSIFAARTDLKTEITAEPSKALWVSSSCSEGRYMNFYRFDTSSVDKANCTLGPIAVAKDHLQCFGCKRLSPPSSAHRQGGVWNTYLRTWLRKPAHALRIT